MKKFFMKVKIAFIGIYFPFFVSFLLLRYFTINDLVQSMLNKTESQQISDAKTDPDCFEPLYVKYYPAILKFIYKRMEYLDDAREICAIVFAHAILKIKKYEDRGHPFSSWLYRIAINEINQFYRRSKKARVISIDEMEISNIADESHIGKKESLVVLKKSLLYLKPDELLLIELRFFDGLPFSEIGLIIGVTENNAKVKTYRILDKLKTIFMKIG